MNITPFAIQCVALALTAWLLPGLKITSLFSLIGLVFVISMANLYIWDTGLFFKLPDNISTQALLTLVCNGVLFFILVRVLPGVECSGLGTALITPVLFSILTIIGQKYSQTIDWKLVADTVTQFVSGVKSSLLPPTTP